MLEWVAMPPPGDVPHRGVEPASPESPVLAGGLSTTSSTWEAGKFVVICCSSNRKLIWGPRNKPGQLSLSGDQQRPVRRHVDVKSGLFCRLTGGRCLCSPVDILGNSGHNGGVRERNPKVGVFTSKMLTYQA